MVPNFDKIHNAFKYNGHHFNHTELKEVAYSLVKEGEPYERVTGDFLIDWLDTRDYILVKTSGSTGNPKSIKLQKQAMVNSAIATGDFFKLKPKDAMMNCLPGHYIAGKMMLVRAMILGLEIDCVAPSTQPIFNTKKEYQFSAMVPLQLENTLDKIQHIKIIILGGSKVSESLKSKIINTTTALYETYGMTETATHIAVKPLESKAQKRKDFFETLPNVSVSQTENDCLIINAPKIVDKPLVTNDVVELKSENSFKWLGRLDNVINSGGVKLFPEQIEQKIHTVIDSRFFIASKKDDKLGECLILIVENSGEEPSEILFKKLKSLNSLTKFEIPKHIYSVPKFSETASGKIQRSKTLKSLFE